MGLLVQRKNTKQFFDSCIRTWRLQIVRVLFSTPVMCAAPLTRPQSRRLSVTELIVRFAKGLSMDLEMSIALWWMLFSEADELSWKEASSILWNVDDRDEIVTAAATGRGAVLTLV